MAIKSFPTAFGGGVNSRGDVTYTHYVVTNLNNSGAGSFADGVADNTIMTFRVSGVVDLTSFYIFDGVTNLIILGQTAPQGGFVLTGQRIRWQNCSNIVIRYLSHRPSNTGNDTWDFLNSSNIYIDHCSLAFGGDETLSFRGTASNVTMNKNIIAYCKTGSLSGDSDNYSLGNNFSLFYNVFSHVGHRMPANINGDTRFDIVGNVSYNWLNRLMRTGGDVQVNEIGNYYKKGVAVSYYHQLNQNDSPSIFTDNNRLTGVLTNNAQDNWAIWQDWNSGTVTGNPANSSYQAGTPFAMLSYTDALPDGDEAYTEVITNKEVGNNVHMDSNGVPVEELETFDDTILTDLASGTYENWSGGSSGYVNFTARTNYLNNLTTGVILNTHTNDGVRGDGIPDAWITSEGLTPATFDPLGHDLDATYTNVEVYSFQVDGAIGNISYPLTGTEKLQSKRSLIQLVKIN